MDWADTPEEARFREEVRGFIKDRFPKSYRPNTTDEQSLEMEDVFGYDWQADRKSPDPDRRAAVMAWTLALAERGWSAPHWPQEYGGAGLGVMEQFILSEEMARAGVPPVGGIGVNLLGPTLIVHGSDEQRREHLPRMLKGEVAWAQGFSEPEAGSDLAALKTRAVRDGDEYVVNGQKIWTSAANHADWLFILARTDPQAPKHRGISFLMMDAKTPGIDIKPITDVRGGVPFNEIFFDNVRVPAEQRVGEENRGWYVAMTLLDFERSGIGGTIKYLRVLEQLRCLLSENHVALRASERESLRLELAQLEIEVNVLYQLALRTVSIEAAGEVPNQEASVSKLFGSEVHQRIANTALKAFGLHGQIWQDGASPVPAFSHDYVGSVADTLMSGSSEIMRNVIATRGLGLPRG